jgi:hypothetical protein
MYLCLHNICVSAALLLFSSTFPSSFFFPAAFSVFLLAFNLFFSSASTRFFHLLHYCPSLTTEPYADILATTDLPTQLQIHLDY